MHPELARRYVLDNLRPEHVDQVTAIARQILATVDPEARYPPHQGTAVARP